MTVGRTELEQTVNHVRTLSQLRSIDADAWTNAQKEETGIERVQVFLLGTSFDCDNYNRCGLRVGRQQ